MKNLSEDFIKIMHNLNIPEKYLTEEYEEQEIDYCATCEGLGRCQYGGYIISKDGKTAKRCYLKVISESRIPPAYINKDFENFEVGQNKRVLERIYEYIRNKEYERGLGLVLVGSCGVGKTHLAVAILKEIAKNSNKSVMFLFVPDFLDEIRKSYEKLEDDDCLRYAKDTFFIVLDDLGTEKITEWSKEKVLQIINYRVNNLLPFLITTNFSGDALKERVGERTYSRIMGACDVLLLQGKDKRLIKGVSFNET